MKVIKNIKYNSEILFYILLILMNLFIVIQNYKIEKLTENQIETEIIVVCPNQNEILNDKETIDETNSAITNENLYTLYTDEEINAMCMVVEAETHEADEESKIHVVHVILNRVSSYNFPDSVIEVCYQNGQFASRSDVQEETRDVVIKALNMSDTTNGALFFHSGNYSDTFNNAYYIFTDSVGHHFYK